MRHMKQAIVTVAMIVALALISNAQISVPHTFTTSVPVSQLNTNLSTIADGALKRNGGNISGNITVDSGITIDNVDISAALGGSGTGAFATVTTSNTGATSIDAAGGITAGTSNVGIIGTDGRIPALTTTYLASLSAASLTGLPSDTGITTTWTTPTYAAGNFTTNGAGGWTVEAADIVSYKYMQIGKTMHVSVVLLATTVTAATGTQLRIAIPNSKIANGDFTNTVIGLDNSTVFAGAWLVSGGVTYITVYKEGTFAVPWTAAANATQMRFVATFEVQ